MNDLQSATHKLRVAAARNIDPDLTDAELAAYRAKWAEPGTIYTCDECGARKNCALVFDAYNTNGDCLASK